MHVTMPSFYAAASCGVRCMPTACMQVLKLRFWYRREENGVMLDGSSDDELEDIAEAAVDLHITLLYRGQSHYLGQRTGIHPGYRLSDLRTTELILM